MVTNGDAVKGVNRLGKGVAMGDLDAIP